MKAPQLIFILIVCIELLLQAKLHGKEKRKNVLSSKESDEVQKYNFWTALITWIIFLTLLYLGGFFNIN